MNWQIINNALFLRFLFGLILTTTLLFGFVSNGFLLPGRTLSPGFFENGFLSNLTLMFFRGIALYNVGF